MYNTKFRVGQVVDILFRNWFLVDPTFILSELNKEEEGATRSLLEVQVIKTNKVLRVHFQYAPIDIDVEIEDVKEVGGTGTQLKTSKQLEISSTLLLTLRSWNLDQLCLRNPIPSIGKCTLMEQSPKVSSPRKKGKTRKFEFNLD
jgi:hypothetical protein